jgi:hypothetical protein
MPEENAFGETGSLILGFSNGLPRSSMDLATKLLASKRIVELQYRDLHTVDGLGRSYNVQQGLCGLIRKGTGVSSVKRQVWESLNEFLVFLVTQRHLNSLFPFDIEDVLTQACIFNLLFLLSIQKNINAVLPHKFYLHELDFPRNRLLSLGFLRERMHALIVRAFTLCQFPVFLLLFSQRCFSKIEVDPDSIFVIFEIDDLEILSP